MMKKSNKNNGLANVALSCLLLAMTVEAFTIPRTSVVIRTRPIHQLQASVDEEQEFDKLLQQNKLRQAVKVFQSKPDLELTRERWGLIFDAIEESTSEADINSISNRQDQDMLTFSESRSDMTAMYKTLKDQGHLKLFGAIDRFNMPAAGGHTVKPSMLEQLTGLSMKALTPKPSNTFLYAGVGVAFIEALASAYFGISLNLLFVLTIGVALTDRVFLNGALSETFLKTLSPKTQEKITRHEAGHFLLAYLLGCPVEGYVLSAWAALQDARFGSRSVSAGTAFVDPDLAKQISSNKVTRSSIDRYSIVVMAGIAAEAVNYGQADGGAGDEMALIGFLTNLNGGPSPNPAWNDVTIRNQARWGAMQAVLLIKEYRECFDSLVDTLERGGSLGDCIYAIENAGRQSGKLPPQRPIGYILERPNGLDEEWVTELPQEVKDEVQLNASAAPKPLDPNESLETLRGYKEQLKEKLRDLDARLSELN
jgi:hypothetical protein